VPFDSSDEVAALVGFAHELADAAGAVILPHFRSQLAVENKAGAAAFDPVTAADRGAEAAMRALIRSRFPSHGILGEEFGAQAGEEATWVLDPVDGTRGFITGLPTWGTLIGLQIHDKPLLGVMDQPFVRDRFIASPLGAELRSIGPDGQPRVLPLRVRPCATLAEAVLSTTSPDLFQGAERDAFADLRHQVRLTRYGGDCYAYSLLALGLIDLVVESGLQPYDIVALVPIIERAGGVVTSWTGGTPVHGGRVVAAGDRRLHEAALKILMPCAG
jgi:histidinol phosphatase-like enzyme (inositol monophosphatase family)